MFQYLPTMPGNENNNNNNNNNNNIYIYIYILQQLGCSKGSDRYAKIRELSLDTDGQTA